MKLDFSFMFMTEQEKMNDVDQFAETTENEQETMKTKMIVSDEEAEEALSKLIWAKDRAKEAADKIKAKKVELAEQLKEYEKRLKGSIENYASYQADLLRTYLYNKFRDEKGVVQKGSIKLFHGTIGLKEARGSVVIADGQEDALVELLKKLGKDNCINTKETVYKEEFAKTFKLDESGHYFLDDKGNVILGVQLEKPDQLQLNVTKPRAKKATAAA